MFEYLLDNPLPAMSVIFGLTSLVISLIRRRKNDRIYFIEKTFLIFYRPKNVPKLKITYEDKEVETLSVSRILIFNDSERTIDKSDLKTIEPIKIHSENKIKIFETNVLHQSKKANNIRIRQTNDSSIELDFDYLDKKEGGIIEIIHNNMGDRIFELTGYVKSIKEIVRMTNPESTPRIILFILARLALIISILLAGFYGFSINNFWGTSILIIGCIIFMGTFEMINEKFDTKKAGLKALFDKL